MSSTIGVRGPRPKYQQLRDILVEMIAKELSADDPIPSESELQERFGLSRMTVRKAVELLVNENRLYRVAGVGTFVAARPTSVELHLSSFSEDMRALGLTPGQRTVLLEERAADDRLAHELAVRAGEPLICLERVRLADGVPVCFERSHLVRRMVPDLTERWADGSLFELLDRVYGLRPTWSRQRITATPADEHLSAMLDVPPGTSLLAIRQHAYKDKTLVEYCTSLYRTDRYELSIVLDESGLALAPSIR
ncbi:GntR family transcriptional regulator [Nonomuraea lactucae]|uniref:GntR family transcriptional regulator n=1 Tax=Nonomuraea lactucae TaxID=2249762 RepID=UPI000DE216F1|nr:GntR family transcriptional regulator [Nonomuraea lactucae]